MTDLSVGTALLVAGIVLALLHIRLLYINGVADPKPLIIKPTLLEEDKLNNTQRYTETKVIYDSRYENYRRHLSADYAAFLTFLMWTTAILSVGLLSFGIGCVVQSVSERQPLHANQ